MKIKQAGFTLIELVVVITILGILAAFALPRFTSLESQARIASINGLAGSVRAASALAHAQWLAEGSSGSTVSLEGQTINLTGDGYPTEADIDDALQDTTGYTVSGTGVFTLRTNCTVTYDDTGGPGAQSPSVSTDPSGC